MQESCTIPWWKTWKKTSGRDKLILTARWACISLIKLRTSIRFSVFNTSHGKSNNNQISSIGLLKPTSSLARGFRSISLPINRFMGSQGFMGSVVDRKLLNQVSVSCSLSKSSWRAGGGYFGIFCRLVRVLLRDDFGW